MSRANQAALLGRYPHPLARSRQAHPA